jgi:hypothetical protein
MRLGSGFGAAAVLIAAMMGQAQAQSYQPGDPLTAPPPSTPTPAQPLVAPGLPSRADQAISPVVPAAPVPGAPALGAATATPDPGRTVQVTQRQAHPGGVVMSLTSVTFRSDSIIVTASITNASGRAAWLNRGNGMVLIDDRGHGYQFLPPPDNPEVQIAPQSQVTASFVFVGSIDPTARMVELETNPSGSRSDRLTAAPLFQFRLPVS